MIVLILGYALVFLRVILSDCFATSYKSAIFTNLDFEGTYFAKAKFALNASNFQEASNFCLVNFRAVELLTTEHHQAARSLYAIKGFELIETIEKTYLGGIICFVLYRLRMPCIVTRANLSA